MSDLIVSEIFCSLQGESSSAGYPTVFVRLTGCPLRCSYCDSDFAYTGGESMSLARVLDQVAAYGIPRVTVTGGEPLVQHASLDLMTALCDAGYEVSLETGGALDISPVDHRVVKVMDMKTPGSGESEHNLDDNIAWLQPRDQVKFVICDEADYRWARERLEELNLSGRCELLFSPCHGRQDPQALAEWILRDRLPVRFQIQLHKFLWGNERGR